MTRKDRFHRDRAFFCAFLALLSLLLSTESPAFGQQRSRRPMPVGEVTGLEMAIDGSLEGYLGESVKWLLTLYEVVGADTFRPARNATIRVLVSHSPNEALAELHTDRYGRAEVDIPVRNDPNQDVFEVILEARSRNVSRDFSATITPVVSDAISLIVDRPLVQPGERVTFLGRAIHLPSRRPLVGRHVFLSIMDQDGRLIGHQRELETGITGGFLVDVEVPDGIRSLQVETRILGVGYASASTTVSTPTAPRMVIRAVPQTNIVEPGDVVPVDVMVRRADGRPLRRAKLSMSGAVRGKRAVETDRSGRAQFSWRAPTEVESGPIDDRVVTISANRAGLGSVETSFNMRIAREPFDVGVSVEGGSLIPRLGGRLYVRTLRADGEPAAGVSVHLEGPLVGAHEGRADDAGVVSFDIRANSLNGIEGRDRCGGGTATSVAISVGEEGSRVTRERCLPLDSDGVVRLRLARHLVTAGETLNVELSIGSDAARAPVELVLLQSRGDNLYPLSRQVLRAGARSASIELSPNLTGKVLLRARPLIGRALDPVRGGMAAIWVVPGPGQSPSLGVDHGNAVMQLPNGGEAEGAILVVPLAEADELETRLQQRINEPFAHAPGPTTDALVGGWLAASTPRDDAAPAVVRNGEVIVVSAPDDSIAYGVLRDPVRARARYVRGRLALVVRTLEHRLAGCIPNQIGDIGVRTSGRWTWNRESLRAVIDTNLLTGIVPMTLGGDRLTLEDLEDIDSNFTFDAMARRVTRERLLGLLVELRNLVRDRDLDLWREESESPAPWLQLLTVDRGVAENQFHDAWGNRMAIRRAPGGRARFRFLTPLPQGWELLSAGPDGRFGTGDDLVDPFERVLPEGSAYAEAVAEDDLLARLHRVELSQATVTELAEAFALEQIDLYGAREPEAMGGFLEVSPSTRARDMRSVEHFERTWLPIERAPVSLVDLEEAQRFPLPTNDEPRGYALMALAWTSDGLSLLSRTEHRGGVPLILAAPPVTWLRQGEPLMVPISVALLPEGPRSLGVSIEVDGVVNARLAEEGRSSPILQLGPGLAGEAEIQIGGRREGRGSVVITVGDSSGGAERSITLPVEVRAPGSLREQAAAASTRDTLEIDIDLPRDAEAAEGTLVIAPPMSFLGDPSLQRWIEQDPALVTWAIAVSGGELSSDLVRRLEAVTNRDGFVEGRQQLLSTACATVAWASSTEGVQWSVQATSDAVARSCVAESPSIEELSLDAAMIVALSVAASPRGHSSLSQWYDGHRDGLRQEVRRHRDQRGLLARGAAALLLTDRRDVRGHTMLALVREHLQPGFRGGMVVDMGVGPDDDLTGRDGAEQLIATAALAIAAHQADQHELADELALGLAARAHVATALGGEPLFWLLAARAFGVFGMGERFTVVVEQGETSQRIEIDGEATVIPLLLPQPGRQGRVRVLLSGLEEGTLPLIHSNARYLRRPRAVDGGPLEVELSGDVGYVDGRAAYRVNLANSSEIQVDHPELLISLPAGQDFDEVARQALLEAEGVFRVEGPDGRGVLRVGFNALAPDGSYQVPLAFRWIAAGRREGLDIAAFPADRSWELSLVPSVELDVQFRRERE